MLNSYGPIVIFGAIAAAFPVVTLWIFKFIRPSFRATPEKVMPYECGITPVGSGNDRFSIKFYLVAMLFIIFDIEAVFLYPWAVVFKELKLFGLMEMLVFIALLLVGYVYIWKKGALEWD